MIDGYRLEVFSGENIVYGNILYPQGLVVLLR